MGTRGPLPKDPEKRARRNATPDPVDLRRSDRPRRAPTLPKTYTTMILVSDGDGGTQEVEHTFTFTFLPETRQWYAKWRRSPQATQFVDTDWQRLQMIARLVDGYFRRPSSTAMAEIRQNETKLGATSDDRQRLRWTIRDDDPDEIETESRSRRRTDPRAHLSVVE